MKVSCSVDATQHHLNEKQVEIFVESQDGETVILKVPLVAQSQMGETFVKFEVSVSDMLAAVAAASHGDE